MNTHIRDTIKSLKNLEDGCEVTMRVIVKHKDFKLLLSASDGINTLDVGQINDEAEKMYREILNAVVGVRDE